MGSATCPMGFELFENNCYIFVNQPVFEAEAVAGCEMLGATLVSIHSTAENQFVNMLAGGGRIWIGVMRICAQNVNTCFVNVDGTPFDLIPPPWSAGQPNNADGMQNCVQMGFPTAGQWNDLDCVAGVNTIAVPYVCKRPL